MQACFNILVLHRKLWCCLSEEANLCCSMLLIPKTRRILTEIEDFISESIWPFFDKKSKMSLWKYFWTSLHKRLKLVYLNSYDFISVQEGFNLLLEKKLKKIEVCDLYIHRNLWGSKGVVERKLKRFFNSSFVAKKWGEKNEKKLNISLVCQKLANKIFTLLG